MLGWRKGYSYLVGEKLLYLKNPIEQKLMNTFKLYNLIRLVSTVTLCSLHDLKLYKCSKPVLPFHKIYIWNETKYEYRTIPEQNHDTYAVLA